IVTEIPDQFLFLGVDRDRYTEKAEMKIAPSTPTLSIAATISSPVTQVRRLPGGPLWGKITRETRSRLVTGLRDRKCYDVRAARWIYRTIYWLKAPKTVPAVRAQ